jgi:hypothetical protein
VPSRRDRWRALVLLLVVAGAACAPGADGSQPDSQPRVLLIIHSGDAAGEQVRGDVNDVVAAAAQDGARLAVYVLDSGSAASMSQVVLSDESNGGDFVLIGGNQRYRDQEARRYSDIVMQDLDPVFDGPSSPTGADVVGAISFGISAVERLPGDGPATVSLVTGGGVHRTVSLDLAAAEVTPESATRIAGQIEPIDVPAGIVVELRGVGRFEGAIPPVDPQFAQGVRVFWEAVCSGCVLN